MAKRPPKSMLRPATQAPKIMLGDRVRVRCEPGQHPAFDRVYEVEGIVILSFSFGDYIDRDIVEKFDGTEKMVGRTNVDRLVIRKENGSYVWAPKPMFKFISILP